MDDEGFLLGEWLTSGWWAGAGVLVPVALWLFTPLGAWLKERFRPAKRPPERTVPFRGVKGREADLAKIREALIEEGTGVLVPGADVVTVSGGGGVGKTTLAKHYAEAHAASYDQIHVIRCERESDMHEDLARLVEGRGRAVDLAAEALVRIRQSRDRWLLIYDNAADLDAIEPMMTEGAYVHILVTSRNRDWTRNRLRRLDLDVLSPEAAVAVLEGEAGFVDEDAGALAEKLGFLPLALVQAAALIKERGGGFAAYLTDLDGVMQTAPLAKDYPRSVFASVELSLRGLSEAETALLNVFAWMAPEGLGADLLAPAAGLPEGHEWRPDIPEPLLRLAQDGAAAEAAVARLARRSLLTPAAEGGGHALHRLTALVLRTRQGDDRDGARAAAAILAAGYPYDSDIHTEWPACARLTPHVLALHDAAGDAPPPTAAMDYLCNQASIYLREQADRPAARALAETGLNLSRIRFGDDHRETGAGRTVLGHILMDMGDPAAARPHYEEALRISRALGAAAADVLPVHLNNLAAVLENLAAQARAGDRAQEAADLVREAQALYREALALDRAAVAKAEAAGDARAATEAGILETSRYNNLSTLNAAAGRKRRALVLAHHAMRRWPDAASPEDPRLAGHLNTLGALHLKLRDPGSALAPLRRALDIFETHLPEGHPRRRMTADWLIPCLLAVDPPQTDAARDLAARYGLPFDAYKRQAETQFRAP